MDPEMARRIAVDGCSKKRGSSEEINGEQPQSLQGSLQRRPVRIRLLLLTILRNMCFAMFGRLALGLLKLIGRHGVSPRALHMAPWEFFSLDPLKWAAVIGGLSAFRLCSDAVAHLSAAVRAPQSIAPLFAGLLCALPVLAMNDSTRTELSLYASVRALYSFCRCSVFPHLPERLQRFNHYDILMMCVSSAQILYGTVFAQRSFPSTYSRFIQQTSMQDPRLLTGVAGLFRRMLCPELVDYCIEKGVSPIPTAGDNMGVICQCLHPNESCNRYYLRFLSKSMLHISLPLYLPLKAVTTVAFQRKELVKRPLAVIAKGVRSVVCSALFLSMFTANSLRVMCTLATFNVRNQVLSAAFAGICTGVATFLEPKGRRMDLALYCVMQASRSFGNTQARYGNLPYPSPRFSLLVYLGSVAYLFKLFEEAPAMMDSKVRYIFSLLLNETAAKQRGATSHS